MNLGLWSLGLRRQRAAAARRSALTAPAASRDAQKETGISVCADPGSRLRVANPRQGDFADRTADLTARVRARPQPRFAACSTNDPPPTRFPGKAHDHPMGYGAGARVHA